MEKQQLRERALSLRSSLKDKEVLSKAISELAIEDITNNNYKYISCYYPTKGEVDTRLILDFCLANGIALFIPHIFPDNTMSMLRLISLEDLEESIYGLMQIRNEIIYSEDRSIDSELVDVVFTPLLSFDKNKFRLGYGKGFYDLYFSSISSKVKKVGLAYSIQEIEELPILPHDIRLDSVITELGII